MERTRRQRLLGVLALVLLFAAYLAWSERPQIVLHYAQQGSAVVHYSFLENDEERLAGEIQPGEVFQFPLRLWRGDDYRVAFRFNQGNERYTSFSTRPGYASLDLYLAPDLSVSTQPLPPGLVEER